MPTLVETITNGAMFTFAPLLLLLAVDLVCWSLPMMRNIVAHGFFHLQWSRVKSGLRREQALKVVQQ